MRKEDFAARPHRVIARAFPDGQSAYLALAQILTRSGQREKNPRVSGSICDALMAQSPGKLTFEINRALIGDGVSATDEEAGRAVAFAFHELKLVVEPGGAVALAALLAGKVDVRGKVAVAVLSGGNVDPELFAKLVA